MPFGAALVFAGVVITCVNCGLGYRRGRASRGKEVAALRHAIYGFLAIVGDSDGVAGCHLNGDVAEWGEFDDVIADATKALRESQS